MQESPKELIVMHVVPLTEKQRYELLSDNVSVTVKGKYLSVWKKIHKTNEPQEEKTAEYIVKNDRTKLIHKISEGKYEISLPTYEARNCLLNPKNGGSKTLYLIHKEHVKKDTRNYLAVHYINICDYDDYNASLTLLK